MSANSNTYFVRIALFDKNDNKIGEERIEVNERFDILMVTPKTNKGAASSNRHGKPIEIKIK